METDQVKANKIVRELMWSKDAFSQWLGLEILEVKPGSCIIKVEIKSEMLNGYNICHGGVIFSVADSACAFASNSRGIQAVSIETSISHIKKAIEGDVIIAKAQEVNLTSKFGYYNAILTNQNDEIIAIFKSTVFLTGQPWDIVL